MRWWSKMNKTIKIDDLSEEVMKALTEYSDEVTEVTKRAVDEVSQEVVNEIKNHVTWKDKKYSKAFSLKTSFEDTRNKRNTWYVKSPHYRLTHLLEFGHITRNGGRTRAFPHVRYGDELAKERLPRKIKEEIENCKV